MTILCLDHLTAWETDPPELVRVAADTGYDAVSLWFTWPPKGTERYPLIGDTPMRRETLRAARETGVGVFSIGLFVMTPGGFLAEWQGMLESGAALGAKRAIVLVYDDDRSRVSDNLARLAAMASSYGITPDVEFIAGSGVASFADACALVRGIDRADVGVIVDPLHLYRTGGVPHDMSGPERNLIRYAQLCDGPAEVPLEGALYEGSCQRMLPGAGVFPLLEFVAELPGDVPIGLEIPLRDLADRGWNARDRSRVAREAASRFLASVGRNPATTTVRQP